MDTLSAGRSDQGRRKNNEDFIAYFEPTDPAELKNYGCLYIVADGVGGAAKGERASQYAAQKILFDYFQPYVPDLDTPDPGLIEPLGYLRSILKQVNEEIHEYAAQNDTRMATTVVVAVVRDGFLYVANVGDSRSYLIRNGIAVPINRDHSLVGEMVEHGEMTEAEAMASSIKNRLTRSLGGDPDVVVDGYPPLQLLSGDKILLCSDGLTRYALQEDIARMTLTGTPEEISERLVKFANDSGGADNVSAIVVAYKSAEAIEQPPLPIPRPQDVDFDTVTPGYQKPKTSHKKDIRVPVFQRLNNKKQRTVVFTSLLVFALVLITVTGWSLFNVIAPSITNTPILPPMAKSTTPLTTETPTVIGYPNPVTETPSITPTVVTSTTTPTASETLTPTPTETPTIKPGPPNEANYLCVSQVNNNPSLISILNKFGQNFDPSEVYYYCSLSSDQTTCEAENTIIIKKK